MSEFSSPRVRLPLFLGRLLRHRAALVGLVLVSITVVLAVFAPLLAPAGPSNIDMINRFAAPGADALMGTDNYGRDVFSRLAYGARVTLLVGVGAVGLGCMIGVIVGLISGYFGGWLDTLLMRVIDIMLSFPSLILALGIMAIIGPGILSVIIAVGISSAPEIARVVRSATLSLREVEFVDAARCIGTSHARILRVHLLPNVSSAIIILAAMNVGSAILVESSLSFLGLGPGPDVPTWGSMVAEGTSYLARSPWMSVFPGLAITLTILGFNLLGDGLRDLLDPRLKAYLK